MRTRILAGLFMMGVSGVAAAQPGMRARGGMGGGPPAAEMLLANTGRLQLTDQQVSRLAAIARRSETRRQALRASMDSARTRFGRGAAGVDSATRRQFAERMRTEADRAREQNHADRRDAIAVLTPDQQARAWEMIAMRGRGRAARGVRGQGMRQGRQMRPMQPMRGMRPMRPERRPDR